jgi:hypothetical protein
MREFKTRHEAGMDDLAQGSGGKDERPSDGSPSQAKQRDAQLDAAIEATFPASDPVASFDFR